MKIIVKKKNYKRLEKVVQFLDDISCLLLVFLPFLFGLLMIGEIDKVNSLDQINWIAILIYLCLFIVSGIYLVYRAEKETGSDQDVNLLDDEDMEEF